MGDLLKRESVFGGTSVPVRLWWGVPRCMESYSEFASWRESLFRTLGWKAQGLLPASTCVGGPVLSCRGLLAVPGGGGSVKHISGRPWFPDPHEYGYFFSRGVLVDTERAHRLYLSATGALDDCGNPALGEEEDLMRGTLNRLRSIIQREAFGTRAKIRWVVWQPSPSALAPRSLALETETIVYRAAELCRLGLQFEIEALAKEWK